MTQFGERERKREREKMNFICSQEDLDDDSSLADELEETDGFVENSARGTAHMFRYGREGAGSGLVVKR